MKLLQNQMNREIWFFTHSDELAHSHWSSSCGSPLGGESYKSQPWPAWSAERQCLCLLHSLPVDGMNSSRLRSLMDSLQVNSFNHLYSATLLTSMITSKSVPNTGLGCLIDSCTCTGSVIKLLGSVARRPAFSYTSLSFVDPVEKIVIHCLFDVWHHNMLNVYSMLLFWLWYLCAHTEPHLRAPLCTVFQLTFRIFVV